MLSLLAGDSGSGNDSPKNEKFSICSFYFPTCEVSRYGCDSTVIMRRITMHQAQAVRGTANLSLARVLAHAVDVADKPRHQIAREAGMHRETLLRVMRAERPIGLDEAASILTVCGAFPRASLILALAGQEDLACEWMRSEMGEFLDEFFATLPSHLERTLGRRTEDVRPRWANGTSQLVARMLAKHIDDFANRDISMSLPR
jgi:DNA-binding phage protein